MTDRDLNPDALLARMSIDEMASLCSGQSFWETQAIRRLGIPAVLMTDGPHGVRKQAGDFERVNIKGVPATCFPTASALANSWDRDLLRYVGEALGEECLEEGVSVLLGPGVNIKRSPLCGRNFEYFSEDPLLAGELAVEWINGLQSKGIGASLKHFAVNNQEYRRMVIDARVDLRALREIYLPAFEIAIKKARPWTVMAAYNRVNGHFCCEHEWLLHHVLRREWGFEGLVVSDWGGCNDRVAGLEAGLDLEMPSSSGLNDREIVAAVRAGTLSQAVLDRSVLRLLKLMAAAMANRKEAFRYDRGSHHELARRAATESIVLLKNERGILPIRPDCKVAVIGEFAKIPRYQGAGSSQINPNRIVSALEALNGLAEFEFATGYRREDVGPVPRLIDEACALAQRCEVAIVFAGLPEAYESEGVDRESMHLPEAHNVLIERIAAVNPNLVVVLSAGAPVEMPWLDKVPALIAGYLGGQASGSAITDILWGRANPSGKLAESWPLALEHTPAYANFPGGPHQVEYRESIFVGYRHYDSFDVAVAFPFGHGLSYTTFDYRNAEASESKIAATSRPVSVSIKNTGLVAGAEIVQVYVQPPESDVLRPKKELKAFCKVWLEPGEEKHVSFLLKNRAFAHFDPVQDDWAVVRGEYQVLFASSSADVRAQASVWVEGDAVAIAEQVDHADRRSNSAFPGMVGPDFDQAMAAMPTAEFPNSYHLNSLLGEVRTTRIGRLLYDTALRSALQMAERSNDPVIAQMLGRTVAEMPLRQLVAFSGGRLTFELMNALLDFMNGRWVSGLRRLLFNIRM